MNKTLFFTVTIGLFLLWILVPIVASIFNEVQILFTWVGVGILTSFFGFALNHKDWELRN